MQWAVVTEMEEEESQAQGDQVDQESLLPLRAVKATSDQAGGQKSTELSGHKLVTA